MLIRAASWRRYCHTRGRTINDNISQKWLWRESFGGRWNIYEGTRREKRNEGLRCREKVFRGNVERTAVLKNQFGELTGSGTQEKEGTVSFCRGAQSYEVCHWQLVAMQSWYAVIVEPLVPSLRRRLGHLWEENIKGFTESRMTLCCWGLQNSFTGFNGVGGFCVAGTKPTRGKGQGSIRS